MFMFGMTGMAHDATVEYNEDEEAKRPEHKGQQQQTTKQKRADAKTRERKTRATTTTTTTTTPTAKTRRLFVVVAVVDAHVKQRLKAPSSHLVSGSFPLRRGTSDSSRRWTSAGGSKTEGRARRRVRTLARPSRLCARALLARPRTPEPKSSLLLKVLLLRSRTSTTTTTTTTMRREETFVVVFPMMQVSIVAEDDRPQKR